MMPDRIIPDKVVYIPITPSELRAGRVDLSSTEVQKECLLHTTLSSLQTAMRTEQSALYSSLRFMMRPLESFRPVEGHRTGDDTVCIHSPGIVLLHPLEGLSLSKSITVYHGSPHNQDELYPGVHYTGEIRYWDDEQSNQYLYATNDREGAVQMGFASLLEQRYPLDRFQVRGKKIIVYLEKGALPQKSDLKGTKVYLYTLLYQHHNWEKLNTNQGFHEYRTQETLDYDILSRESVDVETWLSGYTLSFAYTPAAEKVQYLYFYDICKHAKVQTPAALNLVEPEKQQANLEEAKVQSRIGPEHDRLLCFLEPIPLKHMGRIFGRDHPVWLDGRTIYEHRIQVSDLKHFKYEILETGEMRAFMAAAQKAKGINLVELYEKMAKVMRYRDLTGNQLDQFQHAAAAYVNKATKAFLEFPKHVEYQERFYEFCPTAPHVVIYPQAGELPVDRITAHKIGSEQIPRAHTPSYSKW